MVKKEKAIIEIILENELDLVLAFKKGRQLAETAGLGLADQTKFSTAVSEICRNALVHAGKGKVQFNITNDGSCFFIEALVSDQGSGIHDLDSLLDKVNSDNGHPKSGLMNCRVLSDVFEIECPEEGGTCVKVGRRLPDNHPPINRLILSGWRKHFSESSSVSPYDELKKQNQYLLQALDELKVKEKQAQGQLEEIKHLNHTLKTNFEKIKNLSHEVEIQNQLLKKRNEELDSFAFVVSHDLKAPVSNLEGLLNILEEGAYIEREKILALGKRQIQKINAFITGLLDYSRMGYEKVEKEKVDLNSLIADIVRDMRRPDNFVIQIKEILPVLITEVMIITQVFNNLLSNSIKYNDKQEGKALIGHGIADGYNLFYVEDNGPGIPSSKREEVFKMFTVLQRLDGVDSTGLGLSIIKKIINERGGKIWVEDAQLFSTGSRFCFTWPAQVATD